MQKKRLRNMSAHTGRVVVLACLVATAAVSGCASRVYVPPQGGATATVTYRLTSPIGEGSIFVFEDNNRCDSRKHVGMLQSAPLPYQKLTGAAIDPGLARQVVTIAADKPLKSRVLLDPVGNGNRFCVASFQFLPKRGGAYIANLFVRDEQCEAQVFEAGPSGDPGAQVEVTPATC